MVAPLTNQHSWQKVRNVLWEARQAAEFAAAAREAAVFQRAADAKNLCNTRRDRQITVRKHKRNFLEVRGEVGNQPGKRLGLLVVYLALNLKILWCSQRD